MIVSLWFLLIFFLKDRISQLCETDGAVSVKA